MPIPLQGWFSRIPAKEASPSVGVFLTLAGHFLAVAETLQNAPTSHLVHIAHASAREIDARSEPFSFRLLDARFEDVTESFHDWSQASLPRLGTCPAVLLATEHQRYISSARITERLDALLHGCVLRPFAFGSASPTSD